MKEKIIQIVIFSHDQELAENFKYAINLESKYFKQATRIISDIEALQEVKNINILIVLIGEQTELKFKEYDKKKLEKKAQEFVVIDMKNRTINRNNRTNSLSNTQDDKALAFTILYNYSINLNKKKEKSQLTYNYKKLEQTMDKFERGENKIVIFDKIDEIVMQNRKNNSIGYEKLKTMIYFCIINKIEVDEKKDYNYFYKAIARIFNERVNIVLYKKPFP